MSAGIWFWIIYVFCVLFGGWAWWPAERTSSTLRPMGALLVVFVLIGLLGWRVFGSPLQ